MSMPLQGMGWMPDLPSFKDFRPNSTADKALNPVEKLLEKTEFRKDKRPELVDNRGFFPPIQQQGSLGSCTAHAGTSLYCYYQQRAHGRHELGSRLFLYKVTRNLLKWTGDTGAYLRTTMGAMTLFGVPPEEFYPYDIAKYEEEPEAFHYAFGQNFQALTYFRFDGGDRRGQALVEDLCQAMASGLAIMFGFSVYDSIQQAQLNGDIPVPQEGDRLRGGHAVVMCGYDDNRNGGSFLIRNSWGTEWGEDGYGWLPYDYVRRYLTQDFWTMLSAEWVNTGQFCQ
ncbi:C1 family peptidase [Cryomorphaceae bacterium]|nr:C1 family peptidase [Cryomorphaceae bacterium]